MVQCSCRAYIRGIGDGTVAASPQTVEKYNGTGEGSGTLVLLLMMRANTMFGAEDPLRGFGLCWYWCFSSMIAFAGGLLGGGYLLGRTCRRRGLFSKNQRPCYTHSPMHLRQISKYWSPFFFVR